MVKSSFISRVTGVVRRIPKGRVMTYKEVARAAGHPGAFRAVGSVMKANHDPAVPCHRVIRSDMRPGDYNRPGGERTKVARLVREGVTVSDGRVVRPKQRNENLEIRNEHRDHLSFLNSNL